MKKQIKKGRPAILPSKRRTHKISFYVNDEELKKLESLKIALLNHSPTLSLTEFFRKIVNEADETLLDYLDLSKNDEIIVHLKSRRAYNSLFNKKV